MPIQIPNYQFPNPSKVRNIFLFIRRYFNFILFLLLQVDAKRALYKFPGQCMFPAAAAN
jgi:hypothetical protein